MDLTDYHHRREEQERIRDILGLLPDGAKSILDAGARDGFISCKLADNNFSVTALDLVKPEIDHANVRAVKGDITKLEFPDRTFDAVLCTEVLEHIPAAQLVAACSELQRVARHHVLIGVPYKQDTRIGRTTCYTCGKQNPPWAHVNTFSEASLAELFGEMKIASFSFIGEHRNCTNALSTMLLDLAGNPYGTYDQEEPCIHCGSQLKPPPKRSLPQLVMTRMAMHLNQAQRVLKRPQPNWIHILFTRSQSSVVDRPSDESGHFFSAAAAPPTRSKVA